MLSCPSYQHGYKENGVGYFGYFQSIMSYGIIIWGHCTEWKTIFKLQKKMIRVMMNAPYRESCKPLLKKLNILTFPSLYLYELRSNVQYIVI